MPLPIVDFCGLVCVLLIFVLFYFEIKIYIAVENLVKQEEDYHEQNVAAIRQNNRRRATEHDERDGWVSGYAS